MAERTHCPHCGVPFARSEERAADTHVATSDDIMCIEMLRREHLRPKDVMDLRTQLDQIVLEWTRLAQQWDAEDRAAWDNVQLLFLESTRVMVLRNCTRVLQHLLEAFDG